MPFKPYHGLTADQIKHVQAVYPTLKKIEKATDVPWQLLAGIWYRESFSTAPPKTPGGPWQFDPIPSAVKITQLLNRYSHLSPEEKIAVCAKGVNNFEAGGMIAGCFIQDKVDGNLVPHASDALVMHAIYLYNGAAYGRPEHSPYVYNGYDQAHYPMRIRGTIPDGHGGRVKIDNPDPRPGAYVVYLQLKELFP